MSNASSEKKDFRFFWIIFLGILPFDKSALLLYQSPTAANYLSLALNALACAFSLYYFCIHAFGSSPKNKIAIKYFIYFVFTLVLNLISSAFSQSLSLSRIFSMICLFATYLLCIYKFDTVLDMIKQVNKACAFIILLSFILYLFKNENVFYYENSITLTFKGIAANRNSYSVISLFYVATNVYIYFKERKHLFWTVVLTCIAIFTTVITNSATSIICLLLLGIVCVLALKPQTRKYVSFKLFVPIYLVVFVVIILLQNTNFGLAQTITAFFNKSSDFTGRTELWQTTMQLAMQSFFIGYGFDSMVLLQSGMLYNDPHNGILYIMLTQGLFGLLYFIGMLFFAMNEKKRSTISDKTTCALIYAFLMIWLIRGLVESPFSYAHFVFWISIIALDKLAIEEASPCSLPRRHC